MKKLVKIKYLLLFAIVLGIIAIGYVSCKKPEKEKDYREKWVGKYDCERFFYTFTMTPEGNYTCDTTVQTVLEVFIERDSFIHIVDTSTHKFCWHSMHWEYTSRILRNGTSGSGFGQTSFGIYFSNDSININRRVGALGFNSHSIYKGKKLK